MTKKAIFFTIFLYSIGWAQSKYPADSLLSSSEIGLFNKIGLLPIAAWQRISYNSKLLNCQFYPSCSNYSARAIQEYGILKGGILASDRIVRCNPFAFHYHLKTNQSFHVDGRLADPAIQKHSYSIPNKSPWIAAALSALLPGAGRIYAGRTLDGIMGLWTFYLFGKSAYTSAQNKKPISGPLFGIATGFIYFGEIYGAWRATKLHLKTKIP